jgi:hypothetical protein
MILIQALSLAGALFTLLLPEPSGSTLKGISRPRSAARTRVAPRPAVTQTAR